MDQLEQFCRERGLRLTEHRRTVFDVLERATDHPCAYEVHRRANCDRRVGIATVFRSLNWLTGVGLVTRHAFRDGKARYKRAGMGSPHHLLDLATGQVVEVEDEELKRLLEAAAHELGYRLVNYRLRLFGARTVAHPGGW